MTNQQGDDVIELLKKLNAGDSLGIVLLEKISARLLFIIGLLGAILGALAAD